jgi:NitT/TauT family transport system substrate-binding protein
MALFGTEMDKRNLRRSSVSGLLALLVALAVWTFAASIASAERIGIGAVKLTGNGPIFIALEKSYFAAEGLAAEFVPFDNAVPIASAVVAGDIDFGAAPPSAAFFNMAGRGALRIIASQNPEAPGFHIFAWAASSPAYTAGLKSFEDLAGRSVAITAMGSPQEYSVALVAKKYGIDFTRIRLLPLQSIPNVVSAVIGAQADSGFIPALALSPTLEKSKVRVLGWTDETPWQAGVIMTATKTSNDRREIVDRFLRAYRRGVRDYRDAFIGSDEKPHDGPTAAATRAIIARYTGQTDAQVARGLSYVDSEARLDGADIARQVAWYKSQKLVDADVNATTVVDWRYAIPLPQSR